MAVWIDGSVLADDDAKVSVFDHGFTVGDGVFETAKVTGGTVVALSRHLRRLARSAAALGLAPIDEDHVRGGVAAILSGTEIPDPGRLRITYTGGVAPLGSDRGDAGPTLVVALVAARPWPPSAAAVTVPWTRNERSAVAGVKITSYAENVVALAYARDQGASEAIFANTRGALCEGTGSNVFAVYGDRVVTPALSSGCLAGITRELFLEWSADSTPRGVKSVEETDLSLAELHSADEAFLTSATRDVQPLHQLDGRALPGADGPISRSCADHFVARITATPDP
jgi:branched-chain amino acid aminotransferase